MTSKNRTRLYTAALLLVSALLLLATESAAVGQEKKSPNPLSGDPKAIEEGMALFRGGFCGNCHGMNANGGGRGAPNAANLQKYKRGYTAFLKTVKEGYKTMPAWGAGPELTDEQLNKIGAWLESIAKPEANWKDPQ